jgi:hypothetical protein
MEYNNSQIMNLLAEAVAISTTRPTTPENTYVQQASRIRTRAQQIIAGSIFREYPDELRKFVSDSQYAIALPSRIATVLLNGFPDVKQGAISSGELQIYQTTAQNFLSELNSLQIAFGRFAISELQIPEGLISLDLKIPRGYFGDDSQKYVITLQTFLEIMSYMNELTIGSKSAPILVYTSTTDPVTGIALLPVGIWAFLQLYKLLLEIAEKQISLLKTIKTIRESGIGGEKTATIEGEIRNIVANDLQQATETAVDAAPQKVPQSRVAEIKIAIGKTAPLMLDAVTHGATVNITLESVERMSLVVEQIPDVSDEQINQLLDAQAALEHKITTAIGSLGAPAMELLTDRSPGAKT